MFIKCESWQSSPQKKRIKLSATRAFVINSIQIAAKNSGFVVFALVLSFSARIMNNFQISFGCRRKKARSRRLFTGNKSPSKAVDYRGTRIAVHFYFANIANCTWNLVTSPSRQLIVSAFFISSSAISYQMIHKCCYRLLFETNDIEMMKCGLFSQIFRWTRGFPRMRKRKHFCNKLRTCLFKDICNEIKSFFYRIRVGNKDWLE